jgi:type VI secretion system protein ImpF
MSGLDSRTPVTTPILDRLTARPYRGTIGSIRPGTVAALYLAVQRDLEILLNTRRAEQPVPAGYQLCSSSLLNFGLPDLSLYSLRISSEQHRLRKSIDAAIRFFEPRLSNVSVFLNGWDEKRPVLRFRVEATLKAGAAFEPVVFDTEFRLDSGRFGVKGRLR